VTGTSEKPKANGRQGATHKNCSEVRGWSSSSVGGCYDAPWPTSFARYPSQIRNTRRDVGAQNMVSRRGTVQEISDIVAQHAARNQELVALISRKGGNLQIERTVDLHFWAFNETDATGLAEALRARGLSNVISRVSAKDPAVWNVEGQVVGSLLQVTEARFVEELARVAVAHNADFDGWGTSL